MNFSRDKKTVLCLFIFLLSLTSFSVNVPYWNLKVSDGIGVTSEGFWGIYTNPAVLIGEEDWQANFFSAGWADSQERSYRIFGANVVSPYEYGFSGALDILYGNLADLDGENSYASCGYTIAGSMEKLGWGARVVAGRFNNVSGDSFYGSANFGLKYSIVDEFQLLVSANAPQIVTTNPDIFKTNQPESFWAGAGILASNESARAYLSSCSYFRDDQNFFAVTFGGGFKIFVLNWDFALTARDMYNGIRTVDDFSVDAHISGSVDFEGFSMGVGTTIPVTSGLITDSQIQIFIRAKW